MTIGVGELLALVAATAIIGTIGVAFGIFFLAPRITRRLDRTDEESGAGPD